MNRRFAALALAAALVASLTACTPTVEPEPIPTQESPSPTATPTPEALIVGGGDKPPTVFDDDCSAALPQAELEAALGFGVATFQQRDERWTTPLSSVGGLSCDWSADAASGIIEILPKVGLGGAEFPSDLTDSYFVQCDWVCSWRYETAALWIAGSISGENLDRASINSQGARIGAAIAANFEPSVRPGWQRDTSTWWPHEDCTELAGRIGDALGLDLSGAVAGYVDPPSPGIVLADEASRYVSCGLASATAQATVAVVTMSSGSAWNVPTYGPRSAPYDAGVPGVRVFVTEGGGYLAPVGWYEMTDGVNVATLEIAEGGPLTDADAVAAFAGWLAERAG